MELAAEGPVPQPPGQQPLARSHGPHGLVPIAFHVIASQDPEVLLERLPRNIPRVMVAEEDAAFFGPPDSAWALPEFLILERHPHLPPPSDVGPDIGGVAQPGLEERDRG